MFAAVNADKIFWLVKSEKSTKDCVKLWEEIKAIGKYISTKAVGKNIREDITTQYKFLEGNQLMHLIFFINREIYFFHQVY